MINPASHNGQRGVAKDSGPPHPHYAFDLRNTMESTTVPAVSQLQGVTTTEAQMTVLPANPAAKSGPGKLDLTQMESPKKLSEFRLEDLTIDGICGVY